jgi:Family of unknown function (DUF6169)
LSIPYNYKRVGSTKVEFKTDFGLEYSVTFGEGKGYFPHHPHLAEYLRTVYFQIQGSQESKIPVDSRVGATITFLILQYFEQNPDGALFFIHDGSDGKELGRKKKFDVWFRKVAPDRFRKENSVIEVGRAKIYISILFRQGHPLEAELISAFEAVGATASEKPQDLD